MKPQGEEKVARKRKMATIISVLIFVGLYAWGLIAALVELSGRKVQG